MSEDRHGNKVEAGMRVRVVRLDERDLRGLDDDERVRALSMVRENIPSRGIRRLRTSLGNAGVSGESPNTAVFHSIALEPQEFEIVIECSPKV